jgi:hypothetical protein
MCSLVSDTQFLERDGDFLAVGCACRVEAGKSVSHLVVSSQAMRQNLRDVCLWSCHSAWFNEVNIKRGYISAKLSEDRDVGYKKDYCESMTYCSSSALEPRWLENSFLDLLGDKEHSQEMLFDRKSC